MSVTHVTSWADQRVYNAIATMWELSQLARPVSVAKRRKRSGSESLRFDTIDGLAQQHGPDHW